MERKLKVLDLFAGRGLAELMEGKEQVEPKK